MRATKDKCCKCGKPAVAYWPAIDPDIESHPYCRKCCDEAKIIFLMDMDNILEGEFDEDETDY
jgi:hypothetical protein